MTVLVAITAYLCSSISARAGYCLAFVYMLLLILNSLFDQLSCWPRGKKVENKYFFALFWGIGLGVLVPYVVRQYLLQ